MDTNGSTNGIEPVRSDELVARCPPIDDVVDKPGDFKTEWLVRNNWAAVPVEGAMHFNEEDAHRLSEAIQAAGFDECFAIATEALENFPSCLRVGTSSLGLLAFSRECAHFYFLLTPKTREFGILCTVDDYYVVAGPRSFVNRAVCSSLDEARSSFLEFASSEGWPEVTRNHFLSVAQRYEAFNGS
jgi:hypothetical protein